MIGFYLVCAMLLATALAFVLPPLLRGAPLADASTVKDANLTVYGSQLAELESDLRNGLIAKDQFESDREDIKRRLLEDVSTDRSVRRGAKPVPVSRSLGFALAIALPLASGLLYLQIGNPEAISAGSLPSLSQPQE